MGGEWYWDVCDLMTGWVVDMIRSLVGKLRRDVGGGQLGGDGTGVEDFLGMEMHGGGGSIAIRGRNCVWDVGCVVAGMGCDVCLCGRSEICGGWLRLILHEGVLQC